MTGKQLAATLKCVAKNQHTWTELSTFVRDDLGSPLRHLAENGSEFEALAKLVENYPDQPVDAMFGAIADLVRNERLSIPNLVSRLNELRANGADGKNELRDDIMSLPLPKMKELVKTLGGKAANKPEATRLLGDYLNGAPMPRPAKTKSSSPNAADSEKIEKAYQQYCDIRDHLSQLSFEEIRARFQPIEKQTKKIIEGLAARLGYRFRGNKTELIEQLRGNLESAKGSRLNAAHIDSA